MNLEVGNNVMKVRFATKSNAEYSSYVSKKAENNLNV